MNNSILLFFAPEKLELISGGIKISWLTADGYLPGSKNSPETCPKLGSTRPLAREPFIDTNDLRRGRWPCDVSEIILPRRTPDFGRTSDIRTILYVKVTLLLN